MMRMHREDHRSEVKRKELSMGEKCRVVDTVVEAGTGIDK